MPEPLGPPTSACGEASSSDQLDRRPPRRTRPARAARSCDSRLPHSRPAGAGRWNVPTRLRQLLVLVGDGVAAAVTWPPASGGSGTAPDVAGRSSRCPDGARPDAAVDADGLDGRADRHRHVQQHQPRSRTRARRAASAERTVARPRAAACRLPTSTAIDPRLGRVPAAGPAQRAWCSPATSTRGVHAADPVGQLVEQAARSPGRAR